MPLDGQIEKFTEIKADPFSLESLIKWLETKEPDEKYEYWCAQCCLGQYFSQFGRVTAIGTRLVTFDNGIPTDFSDAFDQVARGFATFGEALSRARTLHAQGIR